ncbi:hypothetical protein D3C75_872940 [compost metagenome]
MAFQQQLPSGSILCRLADFSVLWAGMESINASWNALHLSQHCVHIPRLRQQAIQYNDMFQIAERFSMLAKDSLQPITRIVIKRQSMLIQPISRPTSHDKLIDSFIFYIHPLGSPHQISELMIKSTPLRKRGRSIGLPLQQSRDLTSNPDDTSIHYRLGQ